MKAKQIFKAISVKKGNSRDDVLIFKLVPNTIHISGNLLRTLVLAVCVVSMSLLTSSCGTIPSPRFQDNMRALGGKPLRSLPGDYWRDVQTLNIEIFLQSPLNRWSGDDGNLVKLVRDRMRTTLEPPSGLRTTCHVVPYGEVQVGESVEIFQADRYMTIDLYVVPVAGDRFSQTVMLQALCRFYPEDTVPEIEKQHSMATLGSRGLREGLEEWRRLKQKQPLKGTYFSPLIRVQESGISIGNTQSFAALVGKLAREVNSECFSVLK